MPAPLRDILILTNAISFALNIVCIVTALQIPNGWRAAMHGGLAVLALILVAGLFNA
jgi:hypothetical protein